MLRDFFLPNKVYKNPCHFVNLDDNFLCCDIYFRMFNGLRSLYKEYFVMPRFVIIDALCNT